MANPHNDAAFDPETITLLAEVLDRAWDALSPDQKKAANRASMAEYILMLAAHGERNTTRLYDSALAHFTKL